MAHREISRKCPRYVRQCLSRMESDRVMSDEVEVVLTPGIYTGGIGPCLRFCPVHETQMTQPGPNILITKRNLVELVNRAYSMYYVENRGKVYKVVLYRLTITYNLSFICEY